MRLDSTKPPALSAMTIVRHGVANGVLRTTGAGLPGVSIARSAPLSPRIRFMPA